MSDEKLVSAIARAWVQAMSNGILTQNSGGGKTPSVQMSFVNQEDADLTHAHLIALACAAQGKPLPTWYEVPS